MTSHVVRKLVYILIYPPRIGAIIHPSAYAVLNTPAALSLIVPESRIPSFSRTPSIISESKGTKIIEQLHPRIARPIAERYISL
jgi:hypothetical protein